MRAAAACVFSALVLAPAAHGAVTVGSDMAGTTFGNAACAAGPCTSTIRTLSSPLAVTSPISGVIVRWRFAQGNNPTEADVTLRVVHPLSPPPSFMWTGVSTGPTHHMPATPASFTDPARLAISAGDGIGVDYPANHGVIATNEDAGASSSNFNGSLANGTTRGNDNAVAGELMLNVDVEPDADHDGFGDETQDFCPANASVQTACPVAPTPAVAKKKCRRKKKKRAAASKKKRCKKKSRPR